MVDAVLVGSSSADGWGGESGAENVLKTDTNNSTDDSTRTVAAAAAAAATEACR